MLSSALSCIYSVIAQLFAFNLPYGFTFGALIVGVFGAPFLVRAFKKLF